MVLRGGWEVPDARLATAQQLRRNLHRRHPRRWTRRTGQRYPNRRLGRHQQRRAPRCFHRQAKMDPRQLFLNKGDGTFEDISHAAGVDQVAFTKGVVAADYDNDGYVDFYVSNLLGDNFLYHNNHDNTFTEVAQASRRARLWSRFRRLVLRLRQRWLARLVRHQLLHVAWTKPCGPTSASLTTPPP